MPPGLVPEPFRCLRQAPFSPWSLVGIHGHVRGPEQAAQEARALAGTLKRRRYRRRGVSLQLQDFLLDVVDAAPQAGQRLDNVLVFHDIPLGRRFVFVPRAVLALAGKGYRATGRRRQRCDLGGTAPRTSKRHGGGTKIVP